MKKSKYRIHYLALCIFLALGLILSGCKKSKETVANAITTENIETVSVELFDKSSKELDDGQIKKMVEFINEAEISKEKSVQDIPSKSPLGKISINDDEEILYYYQNGDYFYIEKPYEGIFKTSEDVDRFLAELKSMDSEKISALDGSTDDKETYVDMDAFSENSTKGIACKTKVKEADDGYTILSYDGTKFAAERSDGTNGTGKYFLTLTGRQPQAACDSEFLIIADEQYTFEDVSNDILGLTQPGQVEYFLVDCQPR